MQPPPAVRGEVVSPVAMGVGARNDHTGVVRALALAARGGL